MTSQVNISITATPNKYCAVMTVEKDGTVHKKVVAEDRKASINSNTLQAAIAALKALNRPCMLDIYVNNDYMTGPIRNGWLTEWQRNGWRNARGREVKNRGQWQELAALMARHSIRLTCTRDV